MEDPQCIGCIDLLQMIQLILNNVDTLYAYFTILNDPTYREYIKILEEYNKKLDEYNTRLATFKQQNDTSGETHIITQLNTEHDSLIKLYNKLEFIENKELGFNITNLDEYIKLTDSINQQIQNIKKYLESLI